MSIFLNFRREGYLSLGLSNPNQPRRAPNKSLETDCKGRSFLRLGLLPKMVWFQLFATREITGVAGIPINVLRLEQLMGWHKGSLAYALAAAQFQRYTP